MNTPITDRATLNKWQESCPLQVTPKSLAVALELDRAALMDALQWLDNWLGHKPMPECSKRIADALSAARANFPKP